MSEGEPGLGAAAGGDGRTARALDVVNFFVANLQTAFGPFVSVALTAAAWTQGDIGWVLGAGYLATMVSQVPAGALVDRLRDKRRTAEAALAGVVAGALLLACFPQRLPVLGAELLHGFASATLSPAIAAISLVVVQRSHGDLGERLGRNARYGALGNGIAAGLMAGFGRWLGPGSVFLAGAALAVPGWVALRRIDARAERMAGEWALDWPSLRGLFVSRGFLWFAAAAFLFHLSNAALLPIAAASATEHLGTAAVLLIGACIVGPQLVTALIGPWAGAAMTRRRRLVLAIGFGAVPLRAMLLALSPGPYALFAIQCLDGASAAVFGIALPLAAAAITRGTPHFNLCLGALGLITGAAAAASTSIGGLLADRSAPLAFVTLGVFGILGAVCAATWPGAEGAPYEADDPGDDGPRGVALS